MNCLVEEHGNVNQDSCAYNTRSKKRAMEEVSPQPPNHPSTSSVVPHVQVVSQQHNANHPANTSQQKRQGKRRDNVNNQQIVPPQDSTSKDPTITSNGPFSVVEQMRNNNANISMWDAITNVPSQRRLLQQELESIELRDQPPSMENAMSLVQPSKEVEKIKKVRPPPFYVSLII